MVALFVLIALGFVFMIHMAKGGYVGTGGTILVLFVLALVISAAFSVDFSAVVIFMLLIIALIIVFSVLTTAESDKEQMKKQQEEDASKQAFTCSLQAQLAQATNHIQLHDYYAWTTDTEFCWCSKSWHGFDTELTVHQILLDDINYFVRFYTMPDFGKFPQFEGRFGLIPHWKIKNQNSTKMLYIENDHDCVMDFHYDDYPQLINLLPEKEQKKFKELQHRNTIISIMQKTPYKAFAQLADEINDGSFGIKNEIVKIRMLKKGFCPYEIGKWENGKKIFVYISLEELRNELLLERSVYDLDSFKSGIYSITELETNAKKVQSNTSVWRKSVNSKIKDYIWKHHHELIKETGAEAAFQRWSYRFD